MTEPTNGEIEAFCKLLDDMPRLVAMRYGDDGRIIIPVHIASQIEAWLEYHPNIRPMCKMPEVT